MRALRINCARSPGMGVRFYIEDGHLRIFIPGDDGPAEVSIPRPKAARLSNWLYDAVKELGMPPEEKSDEVI